MGSENEKFIARIQALDDSAQSELMKAIEGVSSEEMMELTTGDGDTATGHRRGQGGGRPSVSGTEGLKLTTQTPAVGPA
jgi:hypothetical protein